MSIDAVPRPAFLDRLKESYLHLKKDFRDIERFVGRDAFTISSTAKRALRSRPTDWKTVGFIVHGKAPQDHMRERGFYLPGMDAKAFERFVAAMERVYFRYSRAMLRELASDPENGIISMWFSCLEPGAKLGLHINNDPYMYRAHLGLTVPEGDLGIKVGDERLRWREGEVLAFDPTVPHTAWNLTDKPRVVFIVDYFRPDEDRLQMQQIEREQFERMMKSNPLSFGMSGGYHDLDAETHRRYAIAEIG
jgi:hypothetical protein